MQESSHNVPKTSHITLITDKLGLGVLLYAYAMLLGAMYIFGYWRAFGFDIFSYLSPIDYISAPLNRMLVLVSAPVFLSLILFTQSNRMDTKLLHKLSAFLILLYALSFAYNFYQAITGFFRSDFYYEDEKSVLAISALLFVASCGFAYRIFNHDISLLTSASALILIQLAATVSAGYADGKAIFNGAANVYFLDNKNLCEPGGIRDWVYLGKFSTKTFFMNTIDKRLCVTGSDSFNLISRKFAEDL